LRLVVADTSPINYLILIDWIDLLPALFETVILPSAVETELKESKASASVRQWIENPPVWLEIRNDAPAFDPDLNRLDPGEKAALALADLLKADLLPIGERDGVKAARKKGLRVTGTLGVLDAAADRGLVNFSGDYTT
jgi:predicted nucleic acid-binding protein